MIKYLQPGLTVQILDSDYIIKGSFVEKYWMLNKATIISEYAGFSGHYIIRRKKNNKLEIVPQTYLFDKNKTLEEAKKEYFSKHHD